jgi:hypothetical protein
MKAFSLFKYAAGLSGLIVAIPSGTAIVEFARGDEAFAVRLALLSPLGFIPLILWAAVALPVYLVRKARERERGGDAQSSQRRGKRDSRRSREGQLAWREALLWGGAVIALVTIAAGFFLGPGLVQRARYLVAPPSIAAPTDLRVQRDPQSQAIALDWHDNADNEAGLNVERKAPGDTNFKRIASLSANSEHTEDPYLVLPGVYCYKACATSKEAQSCSSEACVYVPEPTIWLGSAELGTPVAPQPAAAPDTGRGSPAPAGGGAPWVWLLAAGGILGLGGTLTLAFRRS